MKKIVFALLLAVSPSFSSAESPITAVIVRSQSEPESAVGLLISQSGTIQKTKTNIEKDKNGNTVVTFAVERKEISPTTLASAIVKNKDGTFSYGEMSVLKLPDSKEDLAACKEVDRVPQSLASQLGLLQALVQKRFERRSIAQEKVKLLLTENLLSKLAKLEDAFGLKEPLPLSLDLSPYVLIDRLSRLEAALRTHKANSALKAPAQPQ